MNKKFLVLLATSAMLATPLAATGCAANQNNRTAYVNASAIQSQAVEEDEYDYDYDEAEDEAAYEEADEDEDTAEAEEPVME